MIHRVGIEFEWLAPVGLSKQSFAQVLASMHNERSLPFWHPQLEPSTIPHMPVFHNLTQGFSLYVQDG